jgi:hypothetical protein
VAEAEAEVAEQPEQAVLAVADLLLFFLLVTEQTDW